MVGQLMRFLLWGRELPAVGTSFSAMEQDLPRAASLIHLPAPLLAQTVGPCQAAKTPPLQARPGQAIFCPLSKHQTRDSCQIVTEKSLGHRRHRRLRVYSRPFFFQPDRVAIPT